MQPVDDHTDPTAVDAARALAAGGARVLFGMPGGGPNLELIGAAQQAGLRFVLMHGETAACIAAGTYGLLSGTVGAAVVTRGPGAASATNGLAQATLDRFPLVLLADTVPARSRDRVPHQRLDQLALLEPVTVASATLGRTDAEATVHAAIEAARSHPRGAVHLDVDASAASTDLRRRPAMPAAAGTPAAAALPAAAAAAAAAAGGLAEATTRCQLARRPVIIVGAEALPDGGLHDPTAGDLSRLLTTASCPVLTTYQAKGVLADGAPQAAGLFTNGAAERPLLDAADLVVTVGLDPVEPIPAPWGYCAPVVALTAQPGGDQYLTDALIVTGALGDSLAALVQPLAANDWARSAGQDHRRRTIDALQAGRGAAFGPFDVVEAVPAGKRVTVDAGAHMLVAMPLLDAGAPFDVLISNGLATMGFALPAAIGAALADPQRSVVALTGDGGLGMCLAELETVARLGLDVTVVVCNDAVLSLIHIKQGAAHGGPDAVRFGPVDYAAVARGLGLTATVATCPAELELATPGPRLVDARIDPACYPHVITVTRG